MTIELEKQFFDTFGFEPKTNREYGYAAAIYNEAGEEIKFYPQITDRQYLELICVLNRFDIEFSYFYQEEVETLKAIILEDCLEMKNKFYIKSNLFEQFKHQVQAIFEGER